jgi:hypothetical protein
MRRPIEIINDVVTADGPIIKPTRGAHINELKTESSISAQTQNPEGKSLGQLWDQQSTVNKTLIVGSGALAAVGLTQAAMSAVEGLATEAVVAEEMAAARAANINRMEIAEREYQQWNNAENLMSRQKPIQFQNYDTPTNRGFNINSFTLDEQVSQPFGRQLSTKPFNTNSLVGKNKFLFKKQQLWEKTLNTADEILKKFHHLTVPSLILGTTIAAVASQPTIIKNEIV